MPLQMKDAENGSTIDFSGGIPVFDNREKCADIIRAESMKVSETDGRRGWRGMPEVDLLHAISSAFGLDRTVLVRVSGHE
jgi:hypothetical protein